MAFVYPYATTLRWLGGVSRNYLIGYGLGDIVRVWLGSIFIGMLAWLLVEAFIFMWHYLLRPAPTDKPALLLRKLHWNWLGLSLYQLDITIGGTSRLLFLIDRLRDQQETYFVAPYINIEWLTQLSRSWRPNKQICKPGY